MNPHHDQGPDRVADLFDVAGQEAATIAALDEAMGRLHAVQAAKLRLAQLAPETLRAGLRARTRRLSAPGGATLGGDPA